VVLSDLKSLAKRRSQARVATVEAVDPDVNADGLLNESLYARLEAAYRQPSFATLMSDFAVKLGNSILKDEDINRAFGLDAVQLESRSDSGANSVLDSPIGIPDLDGDIASSLISSPKAKLGNSVLRDEDANIIVDSSAVDLESRSDSRSNSIEDSPFSTRINTQGADISDDKASSSNSSPKAVKRRRRPNVEGNRILKITKNPASRRPRKIKAPKEIPPVEGNDAPVAEERGGKRRLSLRSRIAMKQSKQAASSAAVAHSKLLSPEDQDLWSQEVDDLVNGYSFSLDLTAPLWDHLDRGLLTAAEENRLAIHMKPMKVSASE